MNRAELKEIKRLFTLKGCCVHRLYGCYMDSEKSIRSTWEKNFLSLPEDEIIRYLDLLRKPLSAGLGKNLINTETKLNAVGAAYMLANIFEPSPDLRDAYYMQVIDDLQYDGHFVILAACGTYDIPGKAADGTKIEDADDVYNFTLVCICPVELQKPGLVYDTEAGNFTNLVTSRMLQDPKIGILYPAFNDRAMNMEACLCYSKSMDDSEREFLERQTGSRLPETPKKEREAYKNILEDVLGARATLPEVRDIEEELQALKLHSEFDKEEASLGEDDLQNMLINAGIDKSRLESLHNMYAAEAGKEKLNLDNLGDLRAFTVETAVGRLTVNTGVASRVAIKQIDGKPVLLLDLEGQEYVTVNGIKVGTGKNG